MKGRRIRFNERERKWQLVHDETAEVLVSAECYDDFVMELEIKYGEPGDG